MSDSKKIFYMNGLPRTLKSTVTNQTVFRSQAYALAGRQDAPTSTTSLYSTDDAASILTTSNNLEQPIVYTAYGHRTNASPMPPIGFNGELLNPAMDSYLLGVGYHRLYSPVLMRFACPDTFSPFGDGGFNTYAYCNDDPLNNIDPSGHFSVWKSIQNMFGRKRKLIEKVNTYNTKIQAREQAINELPRFREPTFPEEYDVVSHMMEGRLTQLPKIPHISQRTMEYRKKHFQGTLPEASSADARLESYKQTQQEYHTKGEPYRKQLKVKRQLDNLTYWREENDKLMARVQNTREAERIRKKKGHFQWAQ